VIPEFTTEGLLPEGIHEATREEFEERFVYFDRSDRRFRVYEQLAELLDSVEKSTAILRVLIAGSFVTDKAEPNDFDCVLVVDPRVVGQSLKPFEYNLVSRRAARRRFGGDVVPEVEGSRSLAEYLGFFGRTRDGTLVGIVEIVT
jgi:hypothetical protein